MLGYSSVQVSPIDIEQIVSCAVIQGVARTWGDFDQKAVCNEKLDSNNVRMVCTQRCAYPLYQRLLSCVQIRERRSVESVTESHSVNLNTNNLGKNDKKERLEAKRKFPFYSTPLT